MQKSQLRILASYAPVIFTARYVMFWMRADPLRGQVGGGWALEIDTFWALWNAIDPLGECHLRPKKVEMEIGMGGGWEYIKKLVTSLLN